MERGREPEAAPKRKKLTPGRIILFCLASMLLSSLLIVGIPLAWAAGNSYRVIDNGDGTYRMSDPNDPGITTRVYPVAVTDSQKPEWSVSSIAVGSGGDTYTDEAGNHYSPSEQSATVGFTYSGAASPLILLGDQAINGYYNDTWNTVSPNTATVTAQGCEATFNSFPAGNVVLGINHNAASPDANGAVKGVLDNAWYYPEYGTGKYISMPNLAVQFLDAATGEQIVGGTQPTLGSSYIYGGGIVDGGNQFVPFNTPGGTFATVENLNGAIVSAAEFTYTDDSGAQITSSSQDGGITISGNSLNFSTGYPPYSATLTITLAQPITLTFSASEVYSVWGQGADQSASTYQIAAGTAFPFSLRMNEAKYALTDTAAANPATILSCQLLGDGNVDCSDWGLSATTSEINGVIPATYTSTNREIGFTFQNGSLRTLFGVAPVSGPGYSLVTESGYREGRIVARLTIDAPYNDSTPTLEITDESKRDYNISAEGPIKMDDGTAVWMYYINRMLEGSPEADIVVAVSGVVTNYVPVYDDPPAPSPQIRVENQLDQKDIRSDTTLWPVGTTERDGVSTTTVSDKELDALLELARKHAEDTEHIEGDGLKEGIILIENLSADSKNNTYILELSGKQFETLTAESWDRLTVQTPAGSFSLYPDAMMQTGEEIQSDSDPVRVTLNRLDYEGRPGVDATLTVDKTKVSYFETPYGVRIVVPYTPKEEEDVNAIVVDYIHDDGTVERVTECRYDPEAKGVVFFTTHLSKFGVTYRPAVFEDVKPDHWANPYVTFLASRNVVSGYSGGKFRPDDTATRGEFIALVTKALSATKLPKKPIQVYADVGANSYVASAANWIYFNNLDAFMTDGSRLRPNEPIARQDVAALLNNIASGVGLRIRSKGLDTGYTDADQIPSYAKKAVTRLTAAGVLEMTPNYKFNPKTTINRGELAKIAAELLGNL